MSRIIALDAYRERKLQLEQAQLAAASRIPYVSDADIWTKNYTRLDDIIFGILKVKEILDYHLPYHEEWKHLLLCLLEHAYFSRDEKQKSDLSDAAAILKIYVVEEINVVNKKDMGIALVILELIQKANYRQVKLLN